MSRIDKYVNDRDEVAVLYSPGYGAGWYSWTDKTNTDMLFDVKLVRWVLDDKPTDQATEIESYIEKTYPDAYCGSNIYNMKIAWVPYGTRFRIHEYDGSESVILEKNEIWIEAS